MEMDESQHLGGNIELSGFREIENGTSVVVKKILGNHVRRFMEICPHFEKLSITLKTIHGNDPTKKVELHAKLFCKSKMFSSEITDNNLFVTLDKLLKKLENEAMAALK